MRVFLIFAVGLLIGADRIGNGQDELIDEVRWLGGYYSIDRHTPGKPVIMFWLRGTPIDDRWLVWLKASATLTFLDLTSTNISDAGLNTSQA